MGGHIGAEAAKEESPLEEVEPGDPDWNKFATMIAKRCKEFHHMYNDRAMTMKRLWRVRHTQAMKDDEMQNANMGEPKMLFHGTDPASAKIIAADGFRLPSYAGMFGKGVYFAYTPLKSVQYSKAASPWFSFKSKVRETLFDEASVSGTHKVMFACDVYLGRLRTERLFCNLGHYLSVESKKDLRPTCCDLFAAPHQCCVYACRCGYDSVHAPGGRCWCCHTVRVTEYVIYDPHQAVPRYLIEYDTKKLRKRESGESLVGAPVQVNNEMAATSTRPSTSTRRDPTASLPITASLPVSRVSARGEAGEASLPVSKLVVPTPQPTESASPMGFLGSIGARLRGRRTVPAVEAVGEAGKQSVPVSELHKPLHDGEGEH